MLICDEFKTPMNFFSFSYRSNVSCTFSSLNFGESDYMEVGTQYLKVRSSSFSSISDEIEFNEIKVDSDIKTVNIQNSILYAIPYVFTRFPNIVNFIAEFNGIQYIPSGSFLHAWKLEVLSLKGNAIKVIRENLFKDCKSLAVINLHYNEIELIEGLPFAELHNLKILILSKNKLLTLETGLLNGLANLESINLSFNRFETINPLFFATNKNLETIYLADNRIKAIEKTTFSRLTSINQLYLSNNLLEQLNLELCSAEKIIVNNNQLKVLKLSEHVEHLSVYNNSLVHIEFPETTNFTYLNISSNNLSSALILKITELKTLTTLDLSFNNIGKLNVSTFSKLRKLENFDLEATNVSGIEFGTFTFLTNLKELDLSFNNLRKIDLHMFNSLKNLNAFYIEGNSLRQLDYHNLKTFFPFIRVLGLADNLWNCTYLSKMIHFLKYEVRFYSTISIIPMDPVVSSPNVLGIACYNEDHPKEIVTNPLKHTYLNINGTDGNYENISHHLNDVYEHMDSLRGVSQSRGEIQKQLEDLKKIVHAVQEELLMMREETTDDKFLEFPNYHTFQPVPIWYDKTSRIMLILIFAVLMVTSIFLIGKAYWKYRRRVFVGNWTRTGDENNMMHENIL